MPFASRAKKLGEILIDKGLITPSQLKDALSAGKKSGARLGESLAKLGIVTEDSIAQALSEQFNIPFAYLENLIIEPHVIKMVPEGLARRHKLIPLSFEAKTLKVAISDPLNVFAVDDLKKVSGCRLSPVISTEKSILNAINEYYGTKGATIEDVVKNIGTSELAYLEGGEDVPERLERMAGEASIVKLVNMVISQAVREKASDIHIEPDYDTLRIRMRMDGVLHEVSNLPINLHPAVISRIKVLGDLNIAEKRLPQDGRFQLKIGDSEIDFRLSTMPTVFGEKVVLRLLDKGSTLLKLDELTPLPDSIAPVKTMIFKPFGMILLTGPTGSGKTTTAYTILNILNSMDKNIVTVEDPVEYQLKIINQMQVNPKIGLTFAMALRHMLRQDPDIVMIGEIRDKETAEIAIHAALTGHRVISTIHTNDAVGTISRLLDMGIEPFLISSSVICIVGQRLIRIICPKCKVSYTPDKTVLKKLRLPINHKKPPIFYRGKGCSYCKDMGYKGRMGIFEILVIDNELRNLILTGEDGSVMKHTAIKKGFKILRYQGLRAVIRGHTTVEEVMQATQDIEQD
ncbi:MAG: GspE/PulE family protein [Thermodesulfobacteriota bacterium]